MLRINRRETDAEPPYLHHGRVAMKQARVLLADDHVLVLEGFQRLLDEDFSVVGTAENGQELLDKAQAVRPDVILLDISMPKMNGLDAAQQLKKLLPAVKIVFVTMLSEPTYVTEAFRLGASGFVLKQSAASELVTAVEQVLQNRRFISSHVAPEVRESVLLHPQGAPREGFSGRLTSRQREVLEFLAKGHTTKEIARRLAISAKTVEFHKSKIMHELGIHTPAELTKYAVAHGISSLE